MKYHSFERLVCPRCGSALTPVKSFVSDSQELIYGVVSCNCSQYPVLSSVLVLRKGKETELALKALYAKKFSSALIHAVRWERLPNLSDAVKDKKGFLLGVANFANSAPRSGHIVNSRNLPFREMIKKLGLGRYGNYLIHRFSLHTFWNTHALLPLMKETGDPFLDFGCGAGHSAFVLKHLLKRENYFSVDVNLLNLILTKQYFADTEAICINSLPLLPFKDESIATVFSMDCFHYVKEKAAMAKEFQRVVSKNGSIILPHLHNAKVYNIASGNPLPASAYAKLFERSTTKSFPEDKLLQSFLFNDCLSLDQTYSNEELDVSRATMLMSAPSNRYKAYEKAKTPFQNMRDNLIVNPLYGSPTKRNSEYSFRIKYPLHRGLADSSFLAEYYLTDKVLPKTITIAQEVLQSLNKKECKSYEETISQLIDKFVLINAPNNY